MFAKILLWVKANGASVLGMIQAALKMLKEILTAVINFLSLVVPSASAQVYVIKVRDFINTIDEQVEKIKAQLLTQLL